MSTEIAVRQDRALFFEPRDIDEMGRLAKIVVASRMFAVESPEQAAVIMMTGASLGLSVVAALRGIHVIKGKPVLSSDMMAAVALGSGVCKYLTVVEQSDKSVTVETWREGAPEPVRWTFGEEDARRLGVAGNDNYRKSPRDMYRARATAKVCRLAYPDKLFGVYLPGELDDETATREPMPVQDVSQRLAQLAADDAPLIDVGSDSREAVRVPGEDDDADGPGYTEDELPFR